VDRATRLDKSSVEVQREFAGSRLEREVMIQAYELVVPVVRRRVPTTGIWSEIGRGPDCEARSLRVA
jgi:hypothetical protein